MDLPEENSSGILKSNASQICISNNANFSQIVPEIDPNNNIDLNLHEKSEILADPTLDYISQCLLEEDVDEKADCYHEAALRDMEKPFYDIIGEKYPPTQDQQLLSKQLFEKSNFIISISKDQVRPTFGESSKQKLSIEKLFGTEFYRGLEEGMKFLPNLKKMLIDLPVDQEQKCDNNSLEFMLGQEKESGVPDRSKVKKSSNDEDLDILEGRYCKIAPLSCEETIRDETFDKVLLYHGENYERKEILSLREIMKLKENSQNQEGHTDLRALLISCAEVVSTNNKKVASELLKEIRKKASPIGNGAQRFACIIADGLEARLAGAGSVTYRQIVMRPLSTTEFLKAFHMGMRASPVMRVLCHFANKSILNNVATASEIHVIDFGIFFGFQWPSLIQALAKREGGPPKLRITGIDFPQPGFRPAERVKETGRMLESYARDFEVPFEYQGIVVSQWESICFDDFSIKEDEVLIINSMCHLSKVKDEPLLGMNSPRNKLLKLILEAKPKVFIHGIFNFSFSPFFIIRFKKILTKYATFFDMLDTLVPRDNMQRQLIERTLYGPPVINLIACEGSDLVFRMETYKQWHMRNLQIGFEQNPVDESIVKECNGIIRNGYNEGFFIEVDCNWILLGVKGNINYAISLWKPS
jgi:GRAS domain family